MPKVTIYLTPEAHAQWLTLTDKRKATDALRRAIKRLAK